MKRGLILYSNQDATKNRWFIERCLNELNNDQFSLKFYDENSVQDAFNNDESFDFIINRSRNLEIVEAFAKKGTRFFNNIYTNKVANDKYKTYQFFLRNKIPCIKAYRSINSVKEYPLIMKSVDGHGGNEVYLINSKEEAIKITNKMSHKKFIYQNFIKNSGDLRIYVLGNEVIGAVLRQNDQDFRSNYSLGGAVRKYEIDQSLKETAIRISKLLKADFIGIDFLKVDDGFIANEIEDPVGSRMLYETSNVDAVGLFINYIKQKMQE